MAARADDIGRATLRVKFAAMLALAPCCVPPWHPHLAPHVGLTPMLASWLRTPGSLTARLRTHCDVQQQGHFNVRRLRQETARVHRDEQPGIKLPPRQFALVREVLLCQGAAPLVFAHSVTPLAALDGPWRALVGLGQRPLGEALFANPRIARESLHFARLDVRHPLYRAAARHLGHAPHFLWARRSRFTLEHAPLLVSEVFLPNLLAS